VKRLASLTYSPNAGSPNDRPPFLDLGLLVGAQRRRCLLLARRDFVPDVEQMLADARIRQALHDRGIELVDDRLGRALGRHAHIGTINLSTFTAFIRLKGRNATKLVERLLCP